MKMLGGLLIFYLLYILQWSHLREHLDQKPCFSGPNLIGVSGCDSPLSLCWDIWVGWLFHRRFWCSTVDYGPCILHYIQAYYHALFWLKPDPGTLAVWGMFVNGHGFGGFKNVFLPAKNRVSPATKINPTHNGHFIFVHTYRDTVDR